MTENSLPPLPPMMPPTYSSVSPYETETPPATAADIERNQFVLSGNEEEDIPVLTEIFASQTNSPKGTGTLDDTQIKQLTDDIIVSVKQQLSYELSTLLEATLVGTIEEMQTGISMIVENAVRNHMAQKFPRSNQG